MPLSERIPLGGATLLVWRITEGEEELRRSAHPDDARAAAGLPARRACERLAWRAALRSELPLVEISYSADGAPLVGGAHISVSHCSGAAAVLVSPRRCGCDIEREGRDVARVAPRFIAPAEARLNVGGDPMFGLKVWCAKEAMYKYARCAGLDWLRDMRITSVGGGAMSGRVAGTEVAIGLLRTGGCIVAHICG